MSSHIIGSDLQCDWECQNLESFIFLCGNVYYIFRANKLAIIDLLFHLFLFSIKPMCILVLEFVHLPMDDFSLLQFLPFPYNRRKQDHVYNSFAVSLRLDIESVIFLRFNYLKLVVWVAGC